MFRKLLNWFTGAPSNNFQDYKVEIVKLEHNDVVVISTDKSITIEQATQIIEVTRSQIASNPILLMANGYKFMSIRNVPASQSISPTP